MTDAPTSGKRIRDDRGRVVTQLDPVRLHMLHQYRQIDAGSLDEIVETVAPGTATIGRQVIWIIPATVVFVVVLIAMIYVTSDPAGRQDLYASMRYQLFFAPAVIAACIVPWLAVRRERLRKLRSAMLKHHRCPHCGYSLRGLTADPADRATVCPECGCAWIIDAVALDADLAAMRSSSLGGRRSARTALMLLAGLTVFALLGMVFFFRAL